MPYYNFNENQNIDSAYHMVSFDQYEYEPQRTNNFEVQITGLQALITADSGRAINNASDTIRLAIADSGTPEVTVESLKIRRGNTEVKFAGQASYSDTELVLNDFIGKDVERIMNAWHALTFNPKTQKIGKAGDYKKTAFLIEYSPDHKVVRQWQLFGCWLSKVAYGKYSSNSTDTRQITANMVYDYAVLLDA